MQCEATEHLPVELGGNSTKRRVKVFIDIFGSSTGNALDLKDYLISKLKHGLVYYDFVTEKVGRVSVVKSKTANGRLRVLTIGDNPVKFDEEPSTLDLHDRNRWCISLELGYSKIEA